MACSGPTGGVSACWSAGSSRRPHDRRRASSVPTTRSRPTSIRCWSAFRDLRARSGTPWPRSKRTCSTPPPQRKLTGSTRLAARALAVRQIGPVAGIADRPSLTLRLTPALRRRVVLSTLLIGGVGGIAVGIGGVIGQVVNVHLRRAGPSRPHSRVGSYTSADCYRWLSSGPAARDCVTAMTDDHARDFLISAGLCGVIGVVAIAGLLDAAPSVVEPRDCDVIATSNRGHYRRGTCLRCGRDTRGSGHRRRARHARKRGWRAVQPRAARAVGGRGVRGPRSDAVCAGLRCERDPTSPSQPTSQRFWP